MTLISIPPPTVQASPCVTEHEFFFTGAGPYARTGVLLVHGLTGTPQEMRMLGKALQRAGFTVYGVQLAGHCGNHEDLVRTRWQDWVHSVHDGARRLYEQVDQMIVMGLSMGSVLALEIACARPEWVAGVGAFSTMFRHDGWSIPAYTRLSFLLRPFRFLGIGRNQIFMEQAPYGIKDEVLRQYITEKMHSGNSAQAGLPGNPWYSIIEMRALSKHVQKRLGLVRAPCLVIHARHDDVSSLANATLIARQVQAPVEMVVLRDSYHMVTIDRERRTVAARAVDFSRRLSQLS
nr:alpha/beta fold hydrolase [uncultured Rhodoferax sp.]